MVHGESHLIHVMACRIIYRIGMFLLECECEMLSERCMCTKVESSSYRRYSLQGVAHPLWDNPFRCRVDIGGRRSDEAVIVKKADMWP